MVRKVLNDHSYVTGHTHQQVFHQHNLPLPLDMLHSFLAQTWQRIRRRDSLLHPDDILHSQSWDQIMDTLAQIQHAKSLTGEATVTHSPEDPIPVQAVIHCQYCHFSTCSVSNFRRHQTVHHNLAQLRSNHVDPLTMHVAGNPQCKTCLKTFSTWRSFRIHVERACCQARPKTLPSAPSASTQRALRTDPPVHDFTVSQATS